MQPLKAPDQQTTDVAMLSSRPYLANCDYFEGQPFSYHPSMKDFIPLEKADFDARAVQFFDTFDDFYHAHFQKYKKETQSNVALIRILSRIFLETYGHLPLAYKNTAISSGTWAHLDAVAQKHYTTDKLSDVVGAEWHRRIIKDNSQRSLTRIKMIKDLFPEVFFIGPARFEGAMRVFSERMGRSISSLPWQAPEYMALWNQVIDMCEAFVLDDVRLDAPSVDRVAQEIELARSGRQISRHDVIMQTSDWNNSRNSILEMARGNYIRFGVHPLRPDAKMDMRLYDQETGALYPARLIDLMRPVGQYIARWAPQGIAVDTGAITLARLFHLHRMRTDPFYNEGQRAPLDLSILPPIIAKPSKKEIREIGAFIDIWEPFLLEYLPFLISPNGLPIDYKIARDRHNFVSDVARQEWQMKNIPTNIALDLFKESSSPKFDTRAPCKLPGCSVRGPEQREHDFDSHPFDAQGKEIWPDRPFDELDPMMQALARSCIGVLEVVDLPSSIPSYHGTYRDLKRGDAALAAASEQGLSDLSQLPASLGRSFNDKVREPNLILAQKDMEQARRAKIGKTDISIPAFGTSILDTVRKVINQQRKYFNGPGPHAVPSSFVLAVAMEMMRRNETSHIFSKNWETSEDESRLMLMATKIEFGLVDRSGKNKTEIKVIGENGMYVPFADRIERLFIYLNRLKTDPNIKRVVGARDPHVIEEYGIRHISLTLARFLEIYECMKDQTHNNNRFEERRIQNISGFIKDIDRIYDLKDMARDEICKEWCWLWNPEQGDFDGLRREYRESWEAIHGQQARLSGPPPSSNTGMIPGFLVG